MNLDDLKDWELAGVSYGSVGVAIFVKMSDRKLSEEDGLGIRRAHDLIRESLALVSAQRDPRGLEKRAQYRYEIEKIYRDAGIEAIYLEELPNGYCPDPCCLNKPWFRVTSRIGHVVIGWRKRVMSIDWKDSTIKKSGVDIFPDESTTRSETGIHAWTVEKATEYIRRLHL